MRTGRAGPRAGRAGPGDRGRADLLRPAGRTGRNLAEIIHRGKQGLHENQNFL